MEINICKGLFAESGTVEDIDRSTDGKIVITFKDNSQILVDTFYKQHIVSIENMGLSSRAVNALRENGYYYLHQIPKTKRELLRLPGIADKTAEEIYRNLSLHNFT